MHSTVEVAVLRSLVERALMSELDDIRLAATRPAYLLVVVTHLPECRPEAVGSLRELDTRINAAKGVIRLTLRIDTPGGTLLAAKRLFGCGEDKAVLAGSRFNA